MAKLSLIMYMGLPASGKTTQAKLLAESGYIRINKDDLRAMLYGESYKRRHEKTIIAYRDLLISDALSRGKSVVIDDTNLAPKHRRTLENLAKVYGADFFVDDSFLKVPLDECIKRDLKRPRPVGERVIREMYEKYIRPPVVKQQYNPELNSVYICDIDGTLAYMADRNPYDFSKVHLDDINTGLSHIIDAINYLGYAKVFIFSGREDTCKKETVEWLEKHDIQYELIAMRKEGDRRPDTVVKREMYEEHVKDKYNVLGVFDDRPVVCELWRSMGLTVFQVGSPYIWF